MGRHNAKYEKHEKHENMKTHSEIGKTGET